MFFIYNFLYCRLIYVLPFGHILSMLLYFVSCGLFIFNGPTQYCIYIQFNLPLQLQVPATDNSGSLIIFLWRSKLYFKNSKLL